MTVVFWMLVVFLVKQFIMSKIIRLPLKLAPYKRLSFFIRSFEIVAALIFAVPLFYELSAHTQSYDKIIILTFIMIGIGVGFETLLGICPACGKIFSIPVKGLYKSALSVLERGHCPQCNFSFIEPDPKPSLPDEDWIKRNS